MILCFFAVVRGVVSALCDEGREPYHLPCNIRFGSVTPASRLQQDPPRAGDAIWLRWDNVWDPDVWFCPRGEGEGYCVRDEHNFKTSMYRCETTTESCYELYNSNTYQDYVQLPISAPLTKGKQYFITLCREHFTPWDLSAGEPFCSSTTESFPAGDGISSGGVQLQQPGQGSVLTSGKTYWIRYFATDYDRLGGSISFEPRVFKPPLGEHLCLDLPGVNSPQSKLTRGQHLKQWTVPKGETGAFVMTFCQGPRDCSSVSIQIKACYNSYLEVDGQCQYNLKTCPAGTYTDYEYRTCLPATKVPTKRPTNSRRPTNHPTKFPTRYPTKVPTPPTMAPTKRPSSSPTSAAPTAPTRSPTKFPTDSPTPGCDEASWYDVGLKACRPCAESCSICLASRWNASEAVCSVCKSGYYMDWYKSKCVPCKAGCLTCRTGGYCDVCKPGFFREESGGQCRQCADGCDVCELTACTQCAAGFNLYSKKNVYYQKCVQCPRGMYWYKSSCKPCIVAKCLKCDLGTTCQECEEGYILKDDVCVNEEGVTPAPADPMPKFEQDISICLAFGLSQSGSCLPEDLCDSFGGTCVPYYFIRSSCSIQQKCDAKANTGNYFSDGPECISCPKQSLCISVDTEHYPSSREQFLDSKVFRDFCGLSMADETLTTIDPYTLPTNDNLATKTKETSRASAPCFGAPALVSLVLALA